MKNKRNEEEKKRVLQILKVLESLYPEAECSLFYSNPFELLAATILSAQCTDKRVNEVTPVLFKKYPGPHEMAVADIEDLEHIVRSTGFYRQKAKSLQSMSRDICAKFDGKLPERIEDLTKLAGVGRKTANVVLGNAFNRPAGVVVDTHVKRISRLLGLTKNIDPEKIELDLSERIPKKYWVLFPHWIIYHGRAVCIARRPRCEACGLRKLCPRKGLAKKNALSSGRKKL